MKFCESWSYDGEPTNLLTVKEAEDLYAKKRKFIAYTDLGEYINLYLEITSKIISLISLDKMKRQISSCDFHLNEEKQLYFIRNITKWEYIDESDSWGNRTIYNFVNEKLYEENFSRVTKEKLKSVKDYDNSKNCIETPKFNSYDAIIQFAEKIISSV